MLVARLAAGYPFVAATRRLDRAGAAAFGSLAKFNAIRE
jgi:hypothetical protein